MPKQAKICNHENCNKIVWENSDKCSLHCAKNDYDIDYQSGLLIDFYHKFTKHILEDLYEARMNNLEDDISKKSLEEYLNSRIHDNKSINEILSKLLIVPTSILFPVSNTENDFNCMRILNLFGKIHFLECEFCFVGLNLNNIKYFFQNCTFHQHWALQDYQVLVNQYNIDNVLYQTCTFKKNVSNFINDNALGRLILTNNQFDYTCTFTNINLERVQLNGMLFSSQGYHSASDMIYIENIYFDECLFNDKLILNHLAIGDIKILNCEINAKFEFKYNYVKSILIENSNFMKLVDFHGTIGLEESREMGADIKIHTSIFNDFALFEKSLFNTAQFKYVTFFGTVNFRESQFQSNFDIETINFKDAPNFYRIKLDHPMNSSRETLRIIKYSFDKNGNLIDAGKYFSFEMQKHQQELKKTKWRDNFQEKFVFLVNDKVSSFGQSYLKPIRWITGMALLFGLIIYGQENNWLYQIYPTYNPYISSIVDGINKLVKNIIPFKNILKNGMEFISLFFYIIFSVLIWQTIISLKMYTKRN